MSAPNLHEAVKAMRSYQAVLRASQSNPNALNSWIGRQTDIELASSFDPDATMALLHHFNHPLYTNANLSAEAQAWVQYMPTAAGILADEEAWMDQQITLNNSSMVARIFTSDHQWLRDWGTANNVTPDTPISYIINALISQLRTCEGSGGPTGADDIPHTEHIPPSASNPIP